VEWLNVVAQSSNPEVQKKKKASSLLGFLASETEEYQMSKNCDIFALDIYRRLGYYKCMFLCLFL
jgi:hypothetical protein